VRFTKALGKRDIAVFHDCDGETDHFGLLRQQFEALAKAVIVNRICQCGQGKNTSSGEKTEDAKKGQNGSPSQGLSYFAAIC